MRLKRRELVVVAVTAVMALFTLAGCGGKSSPHKTDTGSTPAPAAKEEVKTLRTSMATGGLGSIIYLGSALGMGGFFNEAGLDVSSRDVPGGADAAKLLISGEIEFASMAVEHVVKANAQGADLVVIHLMTNTPGSAIIVSSQQAGTVKSVKDLKGMKVGVTSLGSGTHAFLSQALISSGLDASAANVQPVGTATMPEALTSGKVAAAVGLDPYVTQLLESKQAVLLLDGRRQNQTQQLYGSDYPFICLATRRELLQKNPDLVKRMVQAFSNAREFVMTKSAKEIADRVPADLRGKDAALYQAAIDASKDMFSKDGLVTDKGLQTIAKTMRDQGAIGADVKVELNKVFSKP